MEIPAGADDDGTAGEMSGTLALVGGGEWSEGCTFDADLLARSGTDVVTVLPTASAYEHPSKVVARASSWFASLGARVEPLDVVRRADALRDDVAEQAAAARFLYLAGGSPMHLRSVLKDSPLWDAIVSAFHGGAVLAAAAEATTVLSTHMVDLRGGAFTVGLDLLADVTVIPRADHWSEDTLHRTVRLAPAGMTVLGIPEGTAVLGTPTRWEVQGSGTVSTYRDGHRIELAAVAPLALTPR